MKSVFFACARDANYRRLMAIHFEKHCSFPTLSRTSVYIIFTVASLILSFYIMRPFRWFSLHPLLMLLAFLTAGSSAIDVKQRGGRENTLIHGYTMCMALLLALGVPTSLAP